MSTIAKTSSTAKKPKTAASQSSRPATSKRDSDSEFVVCIVEGRGIQTEVGMAAIDLRTSSCLISQFADSQSYSSVLHRLHILDPIQILMPKTCVDPQSKLCKIITDHFEATIVPVDRKLFSDVAGLHAINTFGIQNCIQLTPGLPTKYFCLAATGALIKFFENTEKISFVPNSVQFKFQSLDASVTIDALTSRNLELVTNLISPNGPTLFKVLNHTSTPMGSRLLRMNILQPMNGILLIISDEATICTRLDAVEEIVQNESCYFAIRDALKSFKDIDHLITQLVQIPKKSTIKYAENSINHIILLKHTLCLINPLRIALSSLESPLSSAINRLLGDCTIASILDRIDQVINEDVTFQSSALGLRNQRAYAVKAGFNSLLDVARQTYKETTNDVYEYVAQLGERFDLGIKVVYSPNVGFHLTSTSDVDCFPPEFINIVKKKKVVTMTSLRLLSFNDRIQESLNEVYLMSDKTVVALLDTIRSKVGILYKVSESIALIDVIMSFCYYVTTVECVAPEFTDTLAIKGGRHPIRDCMSQDMVPNDAYAYDGCSLFVITGPNMVVILNIVG